MTNQQQVRDKISIGTTSLFSHIRCSFSLVKFLSSFPSFQRFRAVTFLQSDLTSRTDTTQLFIPINKREATTQVATTSMIGHLLAERREANIPSIDEYQALVAFQELDLAPQSRNMPTSRGLAATTQAMKTMELVTLVLVHLPPLEIVRATRVSKNFRDLIHDSPKLQRKTFMREPKRKTPKQFCELVQWGVRLHQRHLKVLPPATDLVANETPTHALAVPRRQLFQSMTVLIRPALPMISLCPLLELSDNDAEQAYWDRQLQVAYNNVPSLALPFRAIAHFSKRATLATERWTTHMQLSSPPTYRAQVKLCWEGRVDGKLCIQLKGETCEVQRAEGITFHSLVQDASSSQGPVSIFTAVRRPGALEVESEANWVRSSEDGSTLFDCMKEFEEREPPYTWSVSTRSEVIFPGVVAPTEGEVRRLADTDQVSSTPVPMYFYHKKSQAEEESESVSG